ncbi:aspartyl/glutamyl-tRNA(Asn/Gln) amidotransferase subunit C [Nocardia farcinica]|uniref:Aspartyl/glutamyl-tRNA(Asn/Gln) amidotransferase subunit C n=1 Tax=Nocardia farcinica TaxID=37329 RepID=A0A0H5P7S6_NOCFR|nr:Aspartyl/glutamyl-tRNA(Asn/Gln) amidotransferase subunit C [Nocardia farcinica]SIT20695.1 aspartyl/glutamyl-tRNA(Asn/Gln) amidotransferase subunit C [Nocardia farcinica]SUE26961.1 asparaginyl/glutamyl-tRNA amidotransferase subunit C [Nocardia farcinica]VFA91982.1 Aspartyl/glutamyl-tRNA(Asn/Gln) amidotransferase subunit C [Nocardia farcinica]
MSGRRAGSVGYCLADPHALHAERGPAVPAISRDEVAHLARLSRLALSDAELDQFAGQLDSILSHVRTISEVAAADVPATASPDPVTNVTRPDTVVPGLTPDQALAAAPAVEEQRFMVPQILGEGE